MDSMHSTKMTKTCLSDLFQEQLNAFKNWMKDEGKLEKTVKAYCTDVENFYSFSGEVETWTTGDVEAYKADLLKKRLKPSTINRKMMAIKQFDKYLSITGKATGIKAKPVKYQQQEYLQEVVTVEDLEKMINLAMSRKDYLMVSLLSALQKSGCRISEILSWIVSDVGKDEIQVVGKGVKVRDVMMPPSLEPMLALYTADRTDQSEPLFMNPKTKKAYSRQWVDKKIKWYAKQCGIKKARAHAHSVRHLYGQRLMKMGMTSREVADSLGHTTTKSTDIYTRNVKRVLKSMINRL